MSTLEKVAERAFVAWVKKNTDDTTRKFGSVRGDPDQIVLCSPGRAYFVEFKRSGETPRREQLRRAKELTDLGYTVLFAFTRDEAIDYYHKFKRGEL